MKIIVKKITEQTVDYIAELLVAGITVNIVLEK